MIYSIDKLMLQTRVLAKNFYQMTGQSLPVSLELAKYDFSCLDILSLQDKSPLIDKTSVHIKAKVLFKPRMDTKIGLLNFKSTWQYVALVLYHSDYYPFEIYMAPRDVLFEGFKISSKALSIAKFKRFSQLVWSN